MSSNKNDIKSIIGSVLGAEDERDVDFVKGYSKYLNMLDISTRYINLINFIANSKCLENYSTISDNLKEFLVEFKVSFNTTFSYDTTLLTKLKDIYPFVTPEDNVEIMKFVTHFSDVKKSHVVKYILNTCSSLIVYKHNLADKETLNDKFIYKYAGTIINILDADLHFNIKHIYLGSNEDNKKIFLLFLHKLYTISLSMYEEYGKPDLNMDNFVKAIDFAIKDLKKKIPRCEQAFKIIEESSKMLETNYPTYYKDYASTNNSMIIAENFIQDVAASVSCKSTKVAFQFKRIITELKKMASNAQSLDPKYKHIIESLAVGAESNYDTIKKQLEEEGEVEEVEEV
jgi:hypothetical protein